jgi:hypothetical protein
MRHRFGVRISSSGPYAIISALFGLYAVFLPTARSASLGANEKLASLVLIVGVGIVDDFHAWISVVIGFAVFLLIAPFCFPRPIGEKGA